MYYEEHVDHSQWFYAEHQQQPGYDHHHEGFSTQNTFEDWQSFSHEDFHMLPTNLESRSSGTIEAGDHNSPASTNLALEKQAGSTLDSSSRKRPYTPESSENESLTGPSKVRKLKDSESTALVRKTGGACFHCTKRKKQVLNENLFRFSEDADHQAVHFRPRSRTMLLAMSGKGSQTSHCHAWFASSIMLETQDHKR